MIFTKINENKMIYQNDNLHKLGGVFLFDFSNLLVIMNNKN